MTRAPRSYAPREGDDWVRTRTGVEAPVLLHALPPEVPFGFVGRVLPAGDDLRLDLEIRPVPAAEALGLIESTGAVAEAELHRRETGEGHRAAQLALEAESASDLGRAIAGRRQELFRIGISLRGRGSSLSAAAHRRTGLLRRLRALGFHPRLPRFEARSALAPPGSLPPGGRPPDYWHTLSTDGVAAFFPFVDEAVVEPGGVLVGLLLDDAAPVVLERFSHGSHSWGLFGATGSGKSFAASLWTLRTRWTLPTVEIFILDPLGEFRGLAEALGGSVVGFGPSEPFRWHPLDPGSTGGDRIEKAARVAMMLKALYPSLRDEESARLDAAISRLYSSDSPAPRFADLRREIEGDGGSSDRLSDLLDLFVTGSLRHLDGAPYGAPLGNPTVFDFQGVPDAQLPFHLAYVLDGLHHRLRSSDRPKLVLVDEAHLLCRSAGTAEFLDRLVRQVRHFQAGLLLLSQSPDDFLALEAGRSMLRNLRATMLLRLSKVSEAAREFFDLTESEAEWLPRARLPKEAGYSEGLLRFGPSHLPLAVAASTPEYEFLVRSLGIPPPKMPVQRHV